MNFKEELEKKTGEAEEIVKRYLPGLEGYQRRVLEAMDYAVSAGGKRLRPLLMRETAALFGEAGEGLSCFMAAIEFIHTYSLIHDDLPALDNDDYRRGRKTAHVVYGEDIAVIAGDGLLNYAYETALRAFDKAVTIADYKRTECAMKILGQK
ncbi:MAG: polyprenyl synthetase family protein, partial [Lachnospiraceae bacterium]|nr:polyprenyl synthetase family protein [Lachnospiraceae bacterium]